MVDCKECDSSFENEHGLEVHMGMKHPDIYNKKSCHDCGNVFWSRHEKMYCDNCSSYAKEKNPAYTGAKEKTKCEECGQEFSYYPSSTKGRFCSECQESRPWVDKETIEEQITVDPPQYGNRKEVECSECGEELPERYESNIFEFNFCSDKCQYTWLSEHLSGENHPHWKEEYPTEINYGKGWRRVKIQALERDDYTCQKCGVDKEELGRNPSVHHIKPVGTFENEQDAHTIENVVSLCPSCHREEEWKIKNGEVRSLEWLPSSILKSE